MQLTTSLKATDIGHAASQPTLLMTGVPLAGGMTLLLTLKQRLANPDCLVDLAGCDLAGISMKVHSIRIGAMTRHVTLTCLSCKAIPAVAHLAGHIGDRQVRNRGTIGGSVANNDPSACYLAVLALGGTVHFLVNRRQ